MIRPANLFAEGVDHQSQRFLAVFVFLQNTTVQERHLSVYRYTLSETRIHPVYVIGGVNNGSTGIWVSFLDGSYGSWVDALSPTTDLHIYRKHVVKATFVVGDN